MPPEKVLRPESAEDVLGVARGSLLSTPSLLFVQDAIRPIVGQLRRRLRLGVVVGQLQNAPTQRAHRRCNSGNARCEPSCMSGRAQKVDWRVAGDGGRYMGQMSQAMCSDA